MIYEVIQTITDGLNIFFKTRLRTNEDKAVISALVNQDGTVAMLEENKVLVTLVNLEREPTPVGPKKDGKQRVHINFFVLFSCYFSNANYGEALKFLAFTMNYLNDNSSIDISDSGGLKSTSSSSGLKVQIEIESLTVDQNSNLWSTTGAKYMPSALYKIRMIPLDSNSLNEFRPSAAVLTRKTQETGGGANNNPGFNPGQGNTNNQGGNTNQNPATKDETTPPANSTPPPSTPPPTETPKTTGKRPVTLGGVFGGGRNDDDDDDDREVAEKPTDDNIPRANMPSDFMSKPAVDIDDEKEEANEENDKIEKSDDSDNDDDRDNRDSRDKRDNDVFSKLNPLKSNRGSSFSPFGLPNKPAEPNIKAPDTDVNKGNKNNPNNDPNKNLNKGPDKI